MRKTKKPQVACERRTLSEPGLRDGCTLLFTCSDCRFYVRCPATSSCAFVDAWTFAPDSSMLVREALVERLLVVLKGEKVCIKLLVESRDLAAQEFFHRYGFNPSSRYGSKLEMRCDFKGWHFTER